ncbi:MAG: CAP domain-containing protein [Patescibacteria group bacterium]
MQNKNKLNYFVVSVAQTTAKTVLSALFFSIALAGGAPTAFANDLIGQEAAIISRTNQVRAGVGLPALTTDSRLMRSAAAKASDMATKGYFAHADASGNRMNYWITPQGYVYSLAGENIAKGYSNIDRLMNAWINSPTHYKNLVEPKFTDIGIGMASGWYEDRETLFIVQHFGVEATQTAKDISKMTAVVAPLIEQVAGISEISTVNASTQSEPVLVNTPVQLTVELPELKPSTTVEVAQVLQPPVSTGGVAGVIWPLWAIMILAAMGFIIDERSILLIRERLSQYRK